MPESLTTRLTRIGFNFFPVFFGMGGRITYIADDWREVTLEIPLSWRTRNYVGTIYGGSMYGAIDPIYMIMLIKNLGPEYVVWDKAATIRFRRPGRRTLTARFTLDEKEIAAVKKAAAKAKSIDREYHIELLDPSGEICAEVDKVVYVAAKNAPATRARSARSRSRAR